MKVKDLYLILQGIYNAYPDNEVVFDVHDPETLAKACLIDDLFLSCLDVREISIFRDDPDDADDPFIRIELLSGESSDCISKSCEEFDRIYKKISE